MSVTSNGPTNMSPSSSAMIEEAIAEDDFVVPATGITTLLDIRLVAGIKNGNCATEDFAGAAIVNSDVTTSTGTMTGAAVDAVETWGLQWAYWLWSWRDSGRSVKSRKLTLPS